MNKIDRDMAEQTNIVMDMSSPKRKVIGVSRMINNQYGSMNGGKRGGAK